MSVLQSRIDEAAPLIQVMVGPRQVGKTTALRTALGGRGVYRTADSPVSLGADVISDWWREASSHPDRLLAIDEVQKIPGWSEAVKKLWDERSGLKLVVTGSSSLLVEKGLRETLAGRFELLRAEHWNYHEAREAFGLTEEKFIEFGCYPGSMPLLGDIHRWGDYVRDAIIEPALGRDLLQLHPVDQPVLLRQVFGTAAGLPAQLISLQKLQGNLQGKGSLPTIRRYLDLLGEAFLVSTVEKYSPSTFRARKSIPKLIVRDNALVRALERPIDAPLSPERFRRYFENLVGARFIESGWKTYYWKDRSFEVDFVAIGPRNQRWAVEVKARPASANELRGLLEFQRLHADFEPCLVSLVSQDFDGIRSINAEEMLGMSRT